jgi:hypothetical protein
MRAYSTFVQIVYLVVPVGGAIYGVATHESYDMGLAICGIIAGVLGLMTAILLHLSSAIVLGTIRTWKPFAPKKRDFDDA